MDDPRLVHLVLGEPVPVEQSRAEVAVDHPHGGVAQHQDQRAAVAELPRHPGCQRLGLPGDRGTVGDVLLPVRDRARLAPLLEPGHEGRVGGPVGCVGPHARERPTEALQAGAGVQQADQARPLTGEVAGEQERVVLADHALRGVGPVEPVDADADHRVLDGTELLDRVVRLGEEALHAIGLASELLQRRFHLPRGFADARQGQLVGHVPAVAGPEQSDSLFHGRIPFVARRPRRAAELIPEAPARPWRRSPG